MARRVRSAAPWTAVLLFAPVITLGAATAARQKNAANEAAPGVTRMELAWQHWVLNCQGCHRADGSGSPQTAPPLAGAVARFLRVPGGREYLTRVPGVASSPLSDAELAELLNWTLWRFDREHLPAVFTPYSAGEVARGRSRPLRVEAPAVRAALLRQIVYTAGH